MRLHDLKHLLGGDHAPQAIGADERNVAPAQLQRRINLNVKLRASAERPGNHVAHGVMASFLGCDFADGEQLRDPGMVARDLGDATVANEVHPTVAYVCHRQLARPHNRERKRRPHSGVIGIAVRLFEHRPVRLSYGPGEAFGHAPGQVAIVGVQDRLDRGSAGHFTRCIAAHAVGDDEQGAPRVDLLLELRMVIDREAIFVVLAPATDVCSASDV